MGYAKLAETMRCANEDCTETVSHGKAKLAYLPRDSKFLKLKKGDVVLVKGKKAGAQTELWGGEVLDSEHFGFFPSAFIKEFMIIHQKPSMIVNIKEFLDQESGVEELTSLSSDGQKITIEKKKSDEVGHSASVEKNENPNLDSNQSDDKKKDKKIPDEDITSPSLDNDKDLKKTEADEKAVTTDLLSGGDKEDVSNSKESQNNETNSEVEQQNDSYSEQPDSKTPSELNEIDDIDTHDVETIKDKLKDVDKEDVDVEEKNQHEGEPKDASIQDHTESEKPLGTDLNQMQLVEDDKKYIDDYEHDKEESPQEPEDILNSADKASTELSTNKSATGKNGTESNVTTDKNVPKETESNSTGSALVDNFADSDTLAVLAEDNEENNSGAETATGDLASTESDFKSDKPDDVNENQLVIEIGSERETSDEAAKKKIKFLEEELKAKVDDETAFVAEAYKDPMDLRSKLGGIVKELREMRQEPGEDSTNIAASKAKELNQRLRNLVHQLVNWKETEANLGVTSSGKNEEIRSRITKLETNLLKRNQQDELFQARKEASVLKLRIQKLERMLHKQRYMPESHFIELAEKLKTEVEKRKVSDSNTIEETGQETTMLKEKQETIMLKEKLSVLEKQLDDQTFEIEDAMRNVKEEAETLKQHLSSLEEEVNQKKINEESQKTMEALLGRISSLEVELEQRKIDEKVILLFQQEASSLKEKLYVLRVQLKKALESSDPFLEEKLQKLDAELQSRKLAENGSLDKIQEQSQLLQEKISKLESMLEEQKDLSQGDKHMEEVNCLKDSLVGMQENLNKRQKYNKVCIFVDNFFDQLEHFRKDLSKEEKLGDEDSAKDESEVGSTTEEDENTDKFEDLRKDITEMKENLGIEVPSTTRQDEDIENVMKDEETVKGFEELRDKMFEFTKDLETQFGMKLAPNSSLVEPSSKRDPAPPNIVEDVSVKEKLHVLKEQLKKALESSDPLLEKKLQKLDAKLQSRKLAEKESLDKTQEQSQLLQEKISKLESMLQEQKDLSQGDKHMEEVNYLKDSLVGMQENLNKRQKYNKVCIFVDNFFDQLEHFRKDLSKEEKLGDEDSAKDESEVGSTTEEDENTDKFEDLRKDITEMKENLGIEVPSTTRQDEDIENVMKDEETVKGFEELRDKMFEFTKDLETQFGMKLAPNSSLVEPSSKRDPAPPNIVEDVSVKEKLHVLKEQLKKALESSDPLLEKKLQKLDAKLQSRKLAEKESLDKTQEQSQLLQEKISKLESMLQEQKDLSQGDKHMEEVNYLKDSLVGMQENLNKRQKYDEVQSKSTTEKEQKLEERINQLEKELHQMSTKEKHAASSVQQSEFLLNCIEELEKNLQGVGKQKIRKEDLLVALEEASFDEIQNKPIIKSNQQCKDVDEKNPYKGEPKDAGIQDHREVKGSNKALSEEKCECNRKEQKLYNPLPPFLKTAYAAVYEAPKWDNDWDKRACDKATATRHIILINHGQYNLAGQGDEQKYLTSLGKEQALFTGLRLKELGLDKKLSLVTYSTMTRAKETCDLIYKQLDAPINLEKSDLLREGAPIEPDPPAAHWSPDSKTFFNDGARIETAFRHFIHRADPEQNDDSFELLVCHGNVIRYFVCRALQIPPEAWLRISLRHASITSLSIRPNGRISLKCLGDSGHLSPDKLTFE